jgi:hypothetical protein
MAFRARDQPLALPAPRLLNRFRPLRRLGRKLPCLLIAGITSTVEPAITVTSALTVVGGFRRELGSGRGEALQGCGCWRSPGGFPTRAAVDSGIANEPAGECLT